MRLLYGEFEHYENYVYHRNIIEGDINICIPFNYSGMKEDITQLGLLPDIEIPDYGDGPIFDKDFDMQYYEWIFSSELRFCRLMHMLETMHNGAEIFIVVSEDSWTNVLTESFFDVLHQRYGIRPYHINSIEDIAYVTETDFDPTFGIRNFNNDIVRYNDLKEINRINNGGRPYDV